MDEPPITFDTDASPASRRVRSFVLRAGRMGSGQERALRELGPRFVVPFTRSALDVDRAFASTVDGVPNVDNLERHDAHPRPLIVEIGFGMGHATAAFAQARPEVNLLGLEVHPPGVGALLRQLGEASVDNVRIVRHDAVEVFEHMLVDGQLAGVHCFFPDPWPKKRHHKRRLIQPPFVDLVTRRLAPQGYLHLATDWEPYAQQMLEVSTAQPGLRNTAGEGFAPRPASRAFTRFERRGLALGHGVWDLLFERTD
jgi:tRNA (guanine-N7-)-methyltransferase